MVPAEKSSEDPLNSGHGTRRIGVLLSKGGYLWTCMRTYFEFGEVADCDPFQRKDGGVLHTNVDMISMHPAVADQRFVLGADHQGFGTCSRAQSL